METKQIVLAERPAGRPTEKTFRTENTEIGAVKEGQLLLKGLYYSVDPYMRGRMNDRKSYQPPFKLNDPIEGAVVAEVVESTVSDIRKGDIVTGRMPWKREIVISAEAVKKVDTSFVSPSAYLGVLGMTGLTAYIGLMLIGKPKKGETVVVSGAAGAVGSVVGQMAHLAGCRVIGIAGTDKKIVMLKDQFGFDGGINYKTEKDLNSAIQAACPDGVDIYFDNVGGPVSDAVMNHLNFHSRIPLCGQISMYNDTEQSTGPRITPILLTRSVLMQGFIVSNYQSHFAEAMKHLVEWVKDGKIKFEETVVEGFDKLPEAFISLFDGKNTGKMVVKA
jgi:hypothetical protein